MVTSESGGTHAFRIYLPHASSVELVGDFTGWQDGPVPMRRDEEGFWHTRVAVPEGDHTFSYLIDGRTWMPDYAASGLSRNPYGNWTSQLCVGRERVRTAVA